ncbi:hypothetical protein F4861DRAFT_73784 [Xylaria intraflava]|nr:hypothetical protein F4861DRAFT_73784 [Xylaria intraflava]
MSDDGGGQSFPFGYVLIPILGFGVVISLFTCCRYRIRRRQSGRQAGDLSYARTLEEGRQQGDNAFASREGQAGGNGDGRRARRLGLGVGNIEEGLNELGEAPPAYTASGPKPPGAEADIPLVTYSQATAEVGTSRSLPQYGEEPQLPAPGLAATDDAHENAGTSEETSGMDATTSTASTEMNESVAITTTTTTTTTTTNRPTTTATATETATTTETTTTTTTNTPATETTTTTTTANGPTTETPSISTSASTPAEPTPPPRAVLPSS